jgi:DNA-binding CsgD family transcriptional regulator
MNIDLDHIGAVTRNVGSPRFGQALFKLFNEAFDIRFYAVFAFVPSSEPRVIVSEGATPSDCEVASKFAMEYVNGRYRDDPKVANCDVSRTPVVYRMRSKELADTRGFRGFLHESRIGYLLIQVGALNGVLYSLNLFRDQSGGAFCAKDVIAMRRLSRFVVPAVHRHVDLERDRRPSLPHPKEYLPSAPMSFNTPAMRDHMRQVFLETPYRLSPREAEVCAGIILGYSTVAIGLNLQIAFDTVATHRKRAYKKLGVCSQNELFARYFEHVMCMRTAA